MKKRISPAHSGFSLVLSLIILTLLAILVVGFLSSTAIDRATAHAFGDKAKAETAAATAANQAMSMLREYIAQYPDSATMWETLTPAAGPAVEGTMLYYNDVPPPTGLDTTSTSTTPKRYMLPLVSIGVDSNGIPLGPVEVKDKTKVLGSDAWHEGFWNNGKSEPDCIDINRPQFNDDKTGWIGATPDGRKPYYAKWIEVKEKANADGKNDEGKAPKTVSRYAFWIEDESFKVNLNLLGNPGRPRTEQAETSEWQKEQEAPAKETPPKPLSPLYPIQIASLPVQGLLTAARAPVNKDTVAKSVVDARSALFGKRMPDLRSFNQVSAVTTSANTQYTLADELKFLATAFSSALNVSRQGSQRLNLNALGFGTDLPTLEKNTPTDVENQIYQMIETIRYHAPKFGQRFYRLENEYVNPTDAKKEADRRNGEVVTPLHQNIYLHKIATNIRDYVDKDVKPTIMEAPNPLPTTVKEQATVRAKFWMPIPTAMSADEGDNAIWAQGKDSAPFLQEVATRFRGGPNIVAVPKPAPGKFPTRYTLKVDYYVEFWNMTGEDIRATQLGPQPFVKIANQIGWREQVDTGSFEKLIADNSPPGHPEAERDYVVFLTPDLSSSPPKLIMCNGVSVPEVVFKAGSCTVITSDPDVGTAKGMSIPDTGGTHGPNTYYSANAQGKREFAGPLRSAKPVGLLPIFGRTPGTSQSDYATEVILGTSQGQIDSHPCAVAMSSVAGMKSPTSDDVYGGSLLGNTITPSQLGDPRTNNEQLVIKGYEPGGVFNQPDVTRYANPGAAPSFNLGWPNSRFVNPHSGFLWKDYYKGWDLTPQTGVVEPQPNIPVDGVPAVLANKSLSSIGQLGDIFDPARVRGVKADGKTPLGTLGITGSRGGGRTLKIGQPDDLLDSTTPNAASRAWASWRLCDFFTTSSDLTLPGAININGLARDNGAALRAAYNGLVAKGSGRAPAKGSVLKSGADWLLNSNEGAATGVQQLIKRALDRVTQNDPSAPGYDATKPYFGPFVERGEISELDVFKQGNTLLTDSGGIGIDMSTAFDHTREQVVRRLIDMTTTRGSIFTVYALGQAITEEPGTHVKRVTGSHQVKVTFQLVPKKLDGTDFGVNDSQQTFVPSPDLTILSKTLKERFAAPHHYDIQILQVGS